MQLIKIDSTTIGQEVKETVNARELHLFLESKADFSTWIKNQIDRARLVENQDFVTVTKKVERQILVDYHLTIEAGKSIGMMCATNKGFEIRDYFLECERRAKSPGIAELLNNPQAMHMALLTYSQQVIERDKLIAEIQPQAAALHRLSLADGSLCMTDAAKTLGIQPQKTLIPYLRANKWIYNRPGCAHPVAYQDKLQQMLLEHKTTTVNRTDGSEKITEQVRITAKGLAKLAVVFGQ